MTIAIVRLGSPRLPGEGLRLGTVRRPPRGVPKAEYAARDFYDVWLPVLSPSAGLLGEAPAHSGSAATWAGFARKFKAEMKRPEAQRSLELLAALSHSTNLSVGCYCEQESSCHRSLLRGLLLELGASMRTA